MYVYIYIATTMRIIDWYQRKNGINAEKTLSKTRDAPRTRALFSALQIFSFVVREAGVSRHDGGTIKSLLQYNSAVIQRELGFRGPSIRPPCWETSVFRPATRLHLLFFRDLPNDYATIVLLAHAQGSFLFFDYHIFVIICHPYLFLCKVFLILWCY